MDFSKLQSIGVLKKNIEDKKTGEFDVTSFLNKADKLTGQIESYFIGEPNRYLDSMDKFDSTNDFAILEMEICASEIIKRFL